MDNLDLKELRRLAEAAQPGPWEYDSNRHTHDSCIFRTGASQSEQSRKYGCISPDDVGVVGSSEWIWIKDEDATYIAAANPTVLLFLLDRLEKAEAMLNYERRPNSDQEWARLDGAVAYHLIDRYADDWADIGNMMEAWAKARAAQENN